MKRIIIAAVLFVALSAPAWAGYREGMAAYNRGDFATALREWRPLATQGHAAAQVSLGTMYAFGRGVPKDHAEAVRWYRMAAEQGNAEAVRWLRRAAEQGNAAAQANLGRMYANGQGVPKDYAEAARWYRKAAEQGHTEAARWLREVGEQGDASAHGAAASSTSSWWSEIFERIGVLTLIWIGGAIFLVWIGWAIFKWAVGVGAKSRAAAFKVATGQVRVARQCGPDALAHAAQAPEEPAEGPRKSNR